jgi:hypothetical protein
VNGGEHQGCLPLAKVRVRRFFAEKTETAFQVVNVAVFFFHGLSYMKYII